jgi:hypothetical protein
VCHGARAIVVVVSALDADPYPPTTLWRPFPWDAVSCAWASQQNPDPNV